MDKSEAKRLLDNIKSFYKNLSEEDKKRYEKEYIWSKEVLQPFIDYKVLKIDSITNISKILLKDYMKVPYPLEVLIKGNRRRVYFETRFLLWYYLNTHFFYTYEEIGILFKKDKNTVYHGIQKVREYLDYDKEYIKEVTETSKKIKENWEKISKHKL